MKWTFTLTIVYGRYADKTDLGQPSANGCFYSAAQAAKSTKGGERSFAATCPNAGDRK